MKKILVIVAIVLLSLSITACGTTKSITEDVGKALTAQGREYDNLISADVGETTTNVFFEWTVSSVWISYDIDGYAPPDGYMYVVADISTTNISYDNNMPLGNSDYIITWGPEDDEWDFSLEEFTNGMYPDEASVEVGKTIKGILVFLVPADIKDVSIIYDEIYDDDFVGDTYSYDITLPDDEGEKL